MPKSIALVYQAGIANVIDVTDPTNPKRLLQHAFSACEWFASGMHRAGCDLKVYSLNRAGDLLLWPMSDWTRGLADCPFRESARPPKEGRYAA